MKRIIKNFNKVDFKSLKQKIIYHSRAFDYSVLLNSNSESTENEFIYAYGCIDLLSSSNQSLKKLDNLINDKDWLFGFFSYDLKNEIENLVSSNITFHSIPNISFFKPKVVIIAKNGLLTFEVCSDLDPEQELNNILNYRPKSVEKKIDNLVPRVSKKKYLLNVKAIQDHIKKGDVYELNYCIDYYSENSIIDPCDVYERLNSITESPMSTLFKFKEINIISSSPERYISKRNNRVFSQPIKGTARRNPNELIDKQIRSLLTKNIKEKAENHMIVDLVRNDLSRISEKGKVKVTELSKLYSFKNVHQLISTIECEIDKNTLVSQIIESTFPMGSMTGAPKIKSMKLIDEFENVSRGIYSGSVGYFMPNGDFDFNVVIRSIIYDSNNQKLNLNIGSAITYNSIAENEYEECQLKAEAMIEALK